MGPQCFEEIKTGNTLPATMSQDITDSFQKLCDISGRQVWKCQQRRPTRLSARNLAHAQDFLQRCDVAKNQYMQLEHKYGGPEHPSSERFILRLGRRSRESKKVAKPETHRFILRLSRPGKSTKALTQDPGTAMPSIEEAKSKVFIKQEDNTALPPVINPPMDNHNFNASIKQEGAASSATAVHHKEPANHQDMVARPMQHRATTRDLPKQKIVSMHNNAAVRRLRMLGSGLQIRGLEPFPERHWNYTLLGLADLDLGDS